MESKNKGFTPLEEPRLDFDELSRVAGTQIKFSNRKSNCENKRFLTGPIRKKFSNGAGFTITEVLTAVAIMALLIGILLPAMTYVRNTAKETMQKAQIGTIEMALTAFRNDYGDYPPSYWRRIGAPTWPSTPDYCGAQKLAEALLGWDLLGFHPDSDWQADGWNNEPYWSGGIEYASDMYFFYDTNSVTDMGKRKGPYLELASANAFTLSQLFGTVATPLNRDRFMLCDVFGVKTVTLANGETVKAGTPILYYKANTSSKTISDPAVASYNRIYDVRDNFPIVALGRVTDQEPHPLGFTTPYSVFYGDPAIPALGYIQDPKVEAQPWPYRPDSYILISAGVDGLYGTPDDITNF